MRRRPPVILDNSRWKSSPDYSYVEDLVAPDLAWEWLRRNEGYQRDYFLSQSTSTPSKGLTPDVRRQWGLEFFRPAVSDGRADQHLLVA
jgi:hypothetical protein